MSTFSKKALAVVAPCTFYDQLCYKFCWAKSNYFQGKGHRFGTRPNVSKHIASERGQTHRFVTRLIIIIIIIIINNYPEGGGNSDFCCPAVSSCPCLLLFFGFLGVGLLLSFVRCLVLPCCLPGFFSSPSIVRAAKTSLAVLFCSVSLCLAEVSLTSLTCV